MFVPSFKTLVKVWRPVERESQNSNKKRGRVNDLNGYQKKDSRYLIMNIFICEYFSNQPKQPNINI